jgi:AcrR family transcriptional regulator
MEAKSLKTEHSEATRAALVRAARQLFARRGYNSVSTEEIVHRARVTRGALYHHFRDKQDLFRAVLEEVERELVAKVADCVAEAQDPWAMFKAGCQAFLDCTVERDVQQIVLTDGPSVLGWKAWHELDEKYGLALISTGLDGLLEAGVLERQPVEPLARLLLGALAEAGLALARSDNFEEDRAQVGESLDRLLEGLRAADRGRTRS